MSGLRAVVNRLPEWTRSRIGLFFLIVIALPYMAIVTLAHTHAVSPIDEWVYLDYLEKVPSQGFVREGEAMSQESLRLMACVGSSPYGPIGPPCADSYTTDQLVEFPQQGLSTASAYTPVYFVSTWLVGTAIDVIPGIDRVDGWRLTGLFWLAGSLVVLFRLARQIGVAQTPAFVVGLAYVASPYSWWTYSYVSTDAPAVLVGGALLTLAIDLARGRGVGWLLVAIGTVGTVIKITNVIGVALALLYLAVVALRRARRREPGIWRLLWPPALALALGAALQVAWLRVLPLLAVSDRRAVQQIGWPLDLQELALQTTNFLPGTITSSPIGPYTPTFVYAPLSWLCVAGVLGAVLLLRARDDTSSLVLAIATASVAAAPALAVTLYVATNSYFQLPPRYGATLLPGMLLLVGLLLRSRPAVVAVGVYGGVLLIVGVWLSAFLATYA